MKIYIVLATQNLQPEVDSVYRFRAKAQERRRELLSSGQARIVEVVEKELE